MINEEYLLIFINIINFIRIVLKNYLFAQVHCLPKLLYKICHWFCPHINLILLYTVVSEEMHKNNNLELMNFQSIMEILGQE